MAPMGQLPTASVKQNGRGAAAIPPRDPSFASAGQATQMIIGASPGSDWQILRLADGLYSRYDMKRVCFTPPTAGGRGTPCALHPNQAPCCGGTASTRRIGLLRKYKLCGGGDILSDENPNFKPLPGPQMQLAVQQHAPVPGGRNTAAKDMLLAVAGHRATSAARIVTPVKAALGNGGFQTRIGVVLNKGAVLISTADNPRRYPRGRETIARTPERTRI